MSSQTLYDISPPQVGLEAMLSGSDFFERLLNSLYDGVYCVDIKRRILFWNRGAELLSGYSREEVLGKYCQDDILQHTDDNNTRLCLDGCPLLRTMQNGEPINARVFLLHKALYQAKAEGRNRETGA